MNPMSKLALAAAATAALGVATTSTSAYAGSNINGPQLTGIALETLEAGQPVIAVVGLPSGEAVGQRREATAVAGTVDPRQPGTD